MFRFGNILSREGKYEECIPYYLRALKILEKQLGKENPDIAGGFNNLGICYLHQKKYENALPLFLGSLKIMEKLFGEEHSEFVQSLNNLADLYK